ncbi:unnamed protein product [Lactuca virosa]|uniref:Uncharacterized protein n=1 Tax=Lactuca virosa TaxID=75947 RepID=A0AAU9M7M1_9ASTR|nr:unnamed protein product [Lactuca virosa]
MRLKINKEAHNTCEIDQPKLGADFNTRGHLLFAEMPLYMGLLLQSCFDMICNDLDEAQRLSLTGEGFKGLKKEKRRV